MLCPSPTAGATGLVEGVAFTKTDEAALRGLHPSSDAWPTTCTSGVVDLAGLFQETRSFNADLSHWDTSSVTNMEDMFNGAQAFNQDLSTWCVSLLPTEPAGFDEGATAWTADRPVWGTCPSR